MATKGIVFHKKHNSKIHSYIQSLNPILKILNLNTSKTPQSLFKPKGGNFIYPMMHRFILYYQAAERTWCYQFNRDVTIEQQCKATCFADKTFCTFAVSIYLRFSFYYSKYISCQGKESVSAADYELTSLTIATESTQMLLEASEEGLCFGTSCFNVLR